MGKLYRLPKRRILRGRLAFQRVFGEGRRLRGRFADLFYLPNDDERRIGFAVSRRIKGHVKKNRAKRRLREAFRLSQWDFPEKGWLVLVGRPEVLEAPWVELMEDVRELGRRTLREVRPGAHT